MKFKELLKEGKKEEVIGYFKGRDIDPNDGYIKKLLGYEIGRNSVDRLVLNLQIFKSEKDVMLAHRPFIEKGDIKKAKVTVEILN